ncbi:MAG: sulfatase-like hydrolase/transferase [Phycisphaeraceae bacterium]
MSTTPPRPNILLITTDQQRYDALGINGNTILQTPNLDHLASRGTNFSRAYSTCPVCIPARRSLISGLHPATHGLGRYHDGQAFDPPCTLPGLLSDAGYQTQLIGKLHLHPQGKRYGYDNMILSETSNWRPDSATQKRNDYVDFLRAHGVDTHPNLHGINGNGRLARPHHLDETLHQSSWLGQMADDFLTRKRDPSCPWFLHLSFFHPHPPLTPPLTYWQRYCDRTDLQPSIGDWAPTGTPPPGLAPDSATGPFAPEQIRLAIAGYYALIQHIDDTIAYVLERYCEYGTSRAAEPLWIIFSSDHGEMLGDHHLFRKSLPYEASAHIPLFISGRNVDAQPGPCDALACWEDLMPTILDLAGVETPAGLDGMSLAPAVRGEPLQPRQHLFGECGGPLANHWIVDGPLKYAWFPRTNEEQLFDLENDPQETRDLSEQTDRLEPLRRQLEAHLADRDDYRYDRAALRPCRNRPPEAIWAGKLA